MIGGIYYIKVVSLKARDGGRDVPFNISPVDIPIGLKKHICGIGEDAGTLCTVNFTGKLLSIRKARNSKGQIPSKITFEYSVKSGSLLRMSQEFQW